MTRIPLRDSSDPQTHPLAKEILEKVTLIRGQSIEPNVYKAMANHPEALEAMANFGSVAYFRNSMTPAQRELAYLTASVTNDCHY